ncbi:MAG TPA: glycine oxidase ThiO [Xanthobacteraceae bacterium]|nr:glycine oxidase ThiO [Xanthobacteraceae bacterium]
MSWRQKGPIIGERLRMADAPDHAGGPAVESQPAAVDVAIVGAGVVGLSVGWRLAASGLNVALFERDEAGAGATGAATGMLAAATELEPGGEDLLALALESQRLWPQFRAELEGESGIDLDYRDEGTLTVALGREEVARLRFRHDLQKRAGLATNWLDGAAARALEPGLRPAVTAGIFCPDDHQVDPRRLVPALRNALAARGGKLIEQVPVYSLDIEGSKVNGVVTPEGLCRAGAVILANGAWAGTRELTGEALSIPVRPLKGQALCLRANARTGLPTHVVWSEQVHLAPKAGGRVVVGSTVEECGFDRAVTAGAVFALLEGARRALPSIEDMEIEAVWTGFRPTSDDDAPILGTCDIAGLVLATGHHRNGILLAPATAQAIHDLVTEGSMAGAAVRFGLARFGGKRADKGLLQHQEKIDAAQR